METAPIIDKTISLAETYAETQLWGVVAFFSVLVIVQFTTMVVLLVKKDKAYVKLIEDTAKVDKEVGATFERRHAEFVDVLNRATDTISKNSIALSKLFDKLSAADSHCVDTCERITAELHNTHTALERLHTKVNPENDDAK